MSCGNEHDVACGLANRCRWVCEAASGWTRALLVFLALSLLSLVARAEDIDGVQCAALDQPRVNMVLRRAAHGPMLAGKTLGEEAFNVEAFLDTGASGVLISTNSAQTLGVKREQALNAPEHEARFEDVGVGGGSQFAVSEPLFVSLAPSTADVENKAAVDGIYSLTCGPFRAQVGPLDSGMDMLTAMALGDMDIAGTPVMAGKVVVMDTRDVNKFADKIRTTVYDARDRGAMAAVPRTKRHVQLSYALFKRFTKTTPANVEGPAMGANPFIGPNPLQPSGDPTPPVTARYHDHASAGSWLLDTGAVASMISRKQAAAVGVKYVANTEGTDNPVLAGVPKEQQFTLSVGGIGGSKKAAGFYLDQLSLRTREGQPLNFLHAPVLVTDITVKDQATGQTLTLDGVFGMNFLVASANVQQAGLMPDIGKLTPGAFRWIVFDQPAGVLGLE